MQKGREKQVLTDRGQKKMLYEKEKESIEHIMIHIKRNKNKRDWTRRKREKQFMRKIRKLGRKWRSVKKKEKEEMRTCASVVENFVNQVLGFGSFYRSNKLFIYKIYTGIS